MKHWLGVILLLFASLLAYGKFEYEYLAPKVLYVGDQIELKLSSNQTRDIRLSTRPNVTNGEWLSNTNQRSTSINGKNTFSTSLFIQPTREGMLQIPELKVLVGAETFVVAPFQREVKNADSRKINVEDQGEVALKDLAFGAVALNGENATLAQTRKTFYVGEQVSLDMFLYCDASQDVRISRYPEFELKDAVFDNPNNPESRIFPPPVVAGKAEHLGRSFRVIRFSSTFYMLKPGEFKFNAENQLSLVRATSRRGGFFSLFDDAQSFPFIVQYPNFLFKVLPLPPVRPGSIFTGTVAPVEIVYQFPQRGKLGEVATLKVTLSAKFNTVKLKTPQLDIPDFRNYGGEQIETANSTVFEYPLIPMKAGVLPISLALSVFDPIVGKYQVYPFEQTIEIAPDAQGRSQLTEVQAGKIAPEPSSATPSTPPTPAEQPDYQKTSIGDSISLPLWENVKVKVWLLLIAGPLVFLFTTWFRIRHAKLKSNHHLRRLQLAKQQQKNIAEQLKKAESMTELLAVANDSLSTYLCNKLDLPPGSSPAEIAEHLSEEESAQTLRFAGTEAFKPDHDESMLDSTKNRLIKLIKTALIFGVFFLPAASLHANNQFAVANAEFAKGEYDKAAEYYRQQLNLSNQFPNVLYNLAAAERALGNDAQALGYLESAYLLDPRDKSITHNLNLIRRNFQLPATPQLKTPSAIFNFWISYLRPDQWLFAGAITYFLMFVVLSINAHTKAWKFFIAAVFASITIGVWSIAFVQSKAEYSPNRAMLLRPVAMYSLPNEQGSEIAVPAAATSVEVIQKVGNYSLIKFGKLQGWILSKALYTVLPGGSF